MAVFQRVLLYPYNFSVLLATAGGISNIKHKYILLTILKKITAHRNGMLLHLHESLSYNNRDFVNGSKIYAQFPIQ
jgi:hypothetical protein